MRVSVVPVVSCPVFFISIFSDVLVVIAAEVESLSDSIERFDGERDGFAAADAEAGDSAAAAGAFERVQQGDEDPGTAAADRVAERDGSAVDVDFLGRNAELAFGDHRARRRRPR